MIYFDNRATTRIDMDALDIMNDIYINKFGNPSSLHQVGFDSEIALRDAREDFANFLGVKSKEIYFTPSATFANNLAIIGTYKGGTCLLNPLEHSSVYNTVLSTYKDSIVEFPLKNSGTINKEEILNILSPEIKFVSLMHVNNETGEIYDIKEITKIIKEYNKDIIVHCDGVQFFGKKNINLKSLGVDIYVSSGHKINGPRGVGLIYVKSGININPIIYGGGQENGLVSGTENVGAICAFLRAYKNIIDFDPNPIYELNSYIKKEIENIPGSKINGENTSPYIISASFSGIKSEPLIHMLESHDVYVSSGSACNKGEDSRVLSRINLGEEYVDGTIRISFDKNSTLEEAKEFVKILKEDINTIRSIMN